MRRGLMLGLVGMAALCLPSPVGARVLRVGTYHGIKGQYTSIQAAVDAGRSSFIPVITRPPPARSREPGARGASFLQAS